MWRDLRFAAGSLMAALGGAMFGAGLIVVLSLLNQLYKAPLPLQYPVNQWLFAISTVAGAAGAWVIYRTGTAFARRGMLLLFVAMSIATYVVVRKYGPSAVHGVMSGRASRR